MLLLRCCRTCGSHRRGSFRCCRRCCCCRRPIRGRGRLCFVGAFLSLEERFGAFVCLACSACLLCREFSGAEGDASLRVGALGHVLGLGGRGRRHVELRATAVLVTTVPTRRVGSVLHEQQQENKEKRPTKGKREEGKGGGGKKSERKEKGANKTHNIASR